MNQVKSFFVKQEEIKNEENLKNENYKNFINYLFLLPNALSGIGCKIFTTNYTLYQNYDQSFFKKTNKI